MLRPACITSSSLLNSSWKPQLPYLRLSHAPPIHQSFPNPPHFCRHQLYLIDVYRVVLLPLSQVSRLNEFPLPSSDFGPCPVAVFDSRCI